MTKTAFYKMWLECGRPARVFASKNYIYMHPPVGTHAITGDVHRVVQMKREDWMAYLARKQFIVAQYDKWIQDFIAMEKEV